MFSGEPSRFLKSLCSLLSSLCYLGATLSFKIDQLLFILSSSHRALSLSLSLIWVMEWGLNTFFEGPVYSVTITRAVRCTRLYEHIAHSTSTVDAKIKLNNFLKTSMMLRVLLSSVRVS
jgi:hypothetical protein